MKKIYFIFVILLFISCGHKSGTDIVEEAVEIVSFLPGTQLIVSGESLNSDYILQMGTDGRVSILENESNTVIKDPDEKYKEILSEIKEELAANKKRTRCKKEQSMWIGKVGIKLTVEGALTGKKGNILACYHKGNKTLIEPNYQVRTDIPVVEVRIGEKYYEIASYTAVAISENGTLQ